MIFSILREGPKIFRAQRREKRVSLSATVCGQHSGRQTRSCYSRLALCAPRGAASRLHCPQCTLNREQCGLLACASHSTTITYSYGHARTRETPVLGFYSAATLCRSVHAGCTTRCAQQRPRRPDAREAGQRPAAASVALGDLWQVVVLGELGEVRVEVLDLPGSASGVCGGARRARVWTVAPFLGETWSLPARGPRPFSSRPPRVSAAPWLCGRLRACTQTSWASRPKARPSTTTRRPQARRRRRAPAAPRRSPASSSSS